MPLYLNQGEHQTTPIEALFKGASQGLLLGTEWRQMKDRREAIRTEDENRKKYIALAEKRVAIEEAEEERRKREFDRQDEIRAGMGAISEERIGRIRPEQTAPGFVQEGGLQEAGKAGMFAPTAFAAGLMQHHQAALDHARKVVAKLPPEVHGEYLQQVEGRLREDTQQAMLAKASSDIDNLGKDLATPEGGGGAEDLLPGITERIQGFREVLQAAADPNLDPKQRAEALRTVQDGVRKQKLDLIQTKVRRKRMAALTATFSQKNDLARTEAMAESIPEDVRATLLARADEREAILIAAQLDPDITTEELMKAWHTAGTASVPRPTRGSSGSDGGSGANGGAPTKEYTYTDALRDARREFGDSTKHKPEDIRKRAEELMRERTEPAKLEAIDKELSEVEPSLDLPFVTEAPSGKGAPAPAAKAPEGAKPAKVGAFTEIPTEKRGTVIESLKAAVRDGRTADLDRIAEWAGFDLDSIPEDVLSKILDTPAAKAPKKNEREVLRGSGPF